MPDSCVRLTTRVVLEQVQLVPSQLDVFASSFVREVVCGKVTTRQHRLGSKITLRASLASQLLPTSQRSFLETARLQLRSTGADRLWRAFEELCALGSFGLNAVAWVGEGTGGGEDGTNGDLR
ncbi:hypothetical protein KC342_g41 [Hortaea werneckii]|nr:hypothetical protein KC342_g41 [Hortaea werneckii]